MLLVVVLYRQERFSASALPFRGYSLPRKGNSLSGYYLHCHAWTEPGRDQPSPAGSQFNPGSNVGQEGIVSGETMSALCPGALELVFSTAVRLGGHENLYNFIGV